MKRLLLATFLLSLFGTGLELLLLEHTEDGWQLIPVVLTGVGFIAWIWYELAPTIKSKQLFRVVLIGFLISGIMGFVLHFDGNMAFELEMYPSMSGGALILESLKGATPVLAPGVMIATGLTGWAYTLC